MLNLNLLRKKIISFIDEKKELNLIKYNHYFQKMLGKNKEDLKI